MANYLYLQIAQQIEKQVESGVYQVGEKLPSVRRIHEEQGVSISTILEAYHYLEDKGVIAAQEKSGYYVRRRKNHEASIPSKVLTTLTPNTIDIDSLLESIMQERFRKEVVSFSRAIPGEHLIPEKILKRTLQEVMRTSGVEAMNYTALEGNEQLRVEIAKRSLGSNLQANGICITSGCLEAIHLALRAVTQQGDIVAVESPCYYGFLEAIQGLRLKTIEIPSHSATGIDLNYLEQACQKYSVKACVVTPNFSNPNGSVMPDAHKKELVALASRYQLPVIEDDIYGELFFQGGRPTLLKQFDREGWVILCSSFSKTLAPGFRLGWIAGGRFHSVIERLKFMTNITSTSLVQLVVANVMQAGSFDRHLKRMRSRLMLQMTAIQVAVDAHFPEGTHVSHPKGGYVLWIELPQKLSSMELYQRAIQRGIGFTPGNLFSSGDTHAHFLRLSCGNEWNETTEDAIRKLGELAKQMLKA